MTANPAASKRRGRDWRTSRPVRKQHLSANPDRTPPGTKPVKKPRNVFFFY